MGASVRGLGGVMLVGALVLAIGEGSATAAATRYAGASGSGTTCSEAVPCSLTEAVEGAATGDTVIVEDGSYTVPGEISTGTQDLTIEGQGSSFPTITLSGGGTVFDLEYSNLTQLSLSSTSGEVLLMLGGTLDRLVVAGNAAAGNDLCQCYGGVLEDSVILNGGAGAAAGVNTNGGSATEMLYNDTLVTTSASGAAIGLYQTDGSPNGSTVALDATNVIADNTAGGHSVLVEGDGGDTTEHLSVTLDHSDYTSPSSSGPGTSIVSGAGNISATPVFGSGLFNFSEAVTSPTIGTGTTSANDGSVDLSGNPRSVDGRTDIGAYEYQFKPLQVSAGESAATAYTGAPVTFSAGYALDQNSGAAPLSFSWSFGDGATATGASVSHAFATPGNYTVSVSLSDGTPYVATSSIQVQVLEPPPTISNPALSPHQPARAHGKHKAKPFSATLTLDLSEAATVKLALSKSVTPRRVHGHCKAPRIARGTGRCPSVSKSLASVSETGAAGLNTFGSLFERLKPGAYEVAVSATNAAGSSQTDQLSFTVR